MICKMTSYDKCLEYEHKFRVLVSELVMDHLSLKQIDKYFFVYKLPERLKDRGRDGLRSEVLAYINEQLLDEWSKTPSALKEVLETLGRPDLSVKVQELVGKSQCLHNNHCAVINRKITSYACMQCTCSYTCMHAHAPAPIRVPW